VTANVDLSNTHVELNLYLNEDVRIVVELRRRSLGLTVRQ
jgi:hypothetical protein